MTAVLFSVPHPWGPIALAIFLAGFAVVTAGIALEWFALGAPIRAYRRVEVRGGIAYLVWAEFRFKRLSSDWVKSPAEYASPLEQCTPEEQAEAKGLPWVR